MKSAFQKISRIPSLAGGIKWYLSDDCLLAAKRLMYTVEYRRFYLRDIESIVVWPSRMWKLRVIIPTAIFVIIGGLVWAYAEATIGIILAVMGLGWLARELALGPTANARVRTTGTSVDLPIVTRARRAQKVLARVDEAVRATRGVAQQPIALASNELRAPNTSQTNESPAATPDLIADASQTSGS